MSVKYTFIAGEEGNYAIYKMCRWVKVSRSGFYEWWGRAPSATAARRGESAALVRFAFEALRRHLGVPADPCPVGPLGPSFR